MPRETVAFWRYRLPHWEILDGAFFVTIRLANCLPEHLRAKMRELIASVSENNAMEHARLYFKIMEDCLDHDSDKDTLNQPEVAKMVQGALCHYDSHGTWKLLAYTLMPNHIHFFVTLKGKNLQRAITDFKRFTSHEFNRMAGQSGVSLWQHDWFDHWSRSPEESEKIIRYIRNNPVKAGLANRWQDWPYTG